MLLWAEPWDIYGGTTSLVSNRGYSDVGLTDVNGVGRTGAKAAHIFNSNITRMALATSNTVMGQGGAWNPLVGIAGSSQNNCGFRFDSAGKIMECTCVAMPDLSIGVYDRTNTLKGTTPPNQLIIGSYVWVEVKVTGNTAGVNTGTVEVRVNGQQKLVVNGINLPNAFAYFGVGGTVNFNGNLDDWIAWDTTGTKNNDFMGDRRLYVSYPNANGALQDFTPSAGSAWDCLNNAPPVDTTFVDGAAAGNISEFAKDLIGISSNDIAAAVVLARFFKTDAGVASGRVGINSVGNVSNSAEQFPGTTGAWFQLIQELDPNGNIAWTRAAYDAASIRITRVQ